MSEDCAKPGCGEKATKYVTPVLTLDAGQTRIVGSGLPCCDKHAKELTAQRGTARSSDPAR